MSSERSVTSSGSRIRQFGLYRTIDARTEEFLRSSRKRQIRQGCACAAISTAITVTVVVSVILVYEYSINSESNVNKKISLKPNWFGLMNESDITSFDSKFNKKINFDRTTLKLLPILLKALNKNRYLEKILEDYSSSSPPYVGKDSTETTFKRNVFSDSKNWLKMPSAKLYTLDYKTSPLIYWKSPTQRLEYLTKIRKIRDYQRMLNYFDKMVSDKVGSNQKRDFEYTENPLVAVTVPMKINKIKKIPQVKYPLEKFKTVKEFNNEDNQDMVSCKCPKKLGQLLTKLITGIQDMIPNLISNKIGISTCVNKSESTKTPQQNPIQSAKGTKPQLNEMPTKISMGSIRNSIRKLTTKWTTLSPKPKTLTKKRTIPSTSTSSTSSYTETTTTSTDASIAKSTDVGITQTMGAKNTASITVIDLTTTTDGNIFLNKYFKDSTIQLPIKANTMLPNSQTYENNTLDYDSIVKPTHVPSTEITTSPQAKRTTTEMFVPIKFVDATNEVSSAEKLFDAYTVDPSHGRTTIPLFREDEYDDYFLTTPKATNNNLDVQGLELVKTKMVSSYDNIYKPQHNFKKMSVKSKPVNYHPVIKTKDLDLSPMRKMADMIYLPKDKYANEAYMQSKKEPKLSVSSNRNQYLPTLHSMSTNAKITNSVESNTSLSSTKFTTSVKNSLRITSSESDDKTEPPMDTKLVIDQGNIDNAGEEEFQDEYGYKQTETRPRQPYKYKNSTRPDVEKEKASPWDLLKNEEKISSISPKSMLPPLRTSYLEIQRNNDWRQDDHADYDINFNNNIFDLPNI